jgi:hypothetical protein
MANGFIKLIEKIVDGNSGEILDETSKVTNQFTVPFTAEPSYFKFYEDHISLLETCSKSEIFILFRLLKTMDYDNRLSVSLGQKKDICRLMGKFTEGGTEPAVNAFNVAMFNLVKKNILTKISSGYYLVNPYLFGKGNWKNVQKLRVKLTYGKPEKK